MLKLVMQVIKGLGWVRVVLESLDDDVDLDGHPEKIQLVASLRRNAELAKQLFASLKETYEIGERMTGHAAALMRKAQ